MEHLQIIIFLLRHRGPLWLGPILRFHRLLWPDHNVLATHQHVRLGTGISWTYYILLFSFYRLLFSCYYCLKASRASAAQHFHDIFNLFRGGYMFYLGLLMVPCFFWNAKRASHCDSINAFIVSSLANLVSFEPFGRFSFKLICRAVMIVILNAETYPTTCHNALFYSPSSRNYQLFEAN